MVENDPVCNFKKCHKTLRHKAWVTSCSHIFCDEDGGREFSRRFVCPSCDTNLSNKYDIVHVNLEPTEVYKSMVLAGQKPENIMEICSRALAFWTYQTCQERAYQQHVANKSKEKIQQIEKYYEQIIQRTEAELSSLRSNVAETRNELADTKRRYDELIQRHSERTSQFNKLQRLYDNTRRQLLNPALNSKDNTEDSYSPTMRPIHNLGIATTDDIISDSTQRLRVINSAQPVSNLGRIVDSRQHSTPNDNDFVFRPQRTPLLNATGANADRRFSQDHP